MKLKNVSNVQGNGITAPALKKKIKIKFSATAGIFILSFFWPFFRFMCMDKDLSVLHRGFFLMSF